jgi:glycosyltransferase involved in cell wall biosynthesis
MKNIVLDCERMKYPNTGLYHYCYQLAKALKRNLGEEEKLSLYLPKNAITKFNTDNTFIQQQALHKFFLPVPKQYSLWHCTYQGSNYMPSNKKAPTVITVHDLNFLYDEQKNNVKKNKYLQALQKNIDKANAIVAISNYVMNDLKKYIDMHNKPTTVIYNGSNINSQLRITNQTIHTKPFLFTIGTIATKKNFHTLPSLLVNNNFDLIIAGIVQDEDYKNEIITTAKKYGIEQRVIFTGAISEENKYWYYQHCEAFVFPSIAEGFGLPVIEAMAFGKPVLLSTLTSLPEIGGHVAYYFDSFEPTAMQQKLIESLDHYKKYEPNELIKQRALSFNWDAAAQQYLQVYRSLY